MASEEDQALPSQAGGRSRAEHTSSKSCYLKLFSRQSSSSETNFEACESETGAGVGVGVCRRFHRERVRGCTWCVSGLRREKGGGGDYLFPGVEIRSLLICGTPERSLLFFSQVLREKNIVLVGFLCKLSSQIKEEVCQPLAKKKNKKSIPVFRNQCLFQSLREVIIYVCHKV